MHIHACGDYYQAVADQPPELKELVRAATGQAVRRVGRFIQLALVGAGRCVGAAALPADTAVYLASGRGDMEITIEVLEQLFRDGQPPKPLSFINTVSNAACFYVAQNFALTGRSSFICNRYFAFESALQLALLDLAQGVVDSALVGVIDVVVPPLAHHRRRLQLGAEQAVADASHWLWLRNEPGDGRGEVLAAQHCSDRAALLHWIAQRRLPGDRTWLSGGQFFASFELESLARACGSRRNFAYRAQRAYYDSHSGAAIAEFLREAPADHYLLHINSDPEGRYSAMLAKS